VTRELTAERDLLTEAGDPDYATAVAARLDASEYGSSYEWCARSRLWIEVAEEALDLGAYCALLLRRLEIDDTPLEQLARLRELLLSIARHGAQAGVLIIEARRFTEMTDAETAA
jgi:hypothetical protein